MTLNMLFFTSLSGIGLSPNILAERLSVFLPTSLLPAHTKRESLATDAVFDGVNMLALYASRLMVRAGTGGLVALKIDSVRATFVTLARNGPDAPFLFQFHGSGNL